MLVKNRRKKKKEQNSTKYGKELTLKTTSSHVVELYSLKELKRKGVGEVTKWSVQHLKLDSNCFWAGLSSWTIDNVITCNKRWGTAYRSLRVGKSFFILSPTYIFLVISSVLKGPRINLLAIIEDELTSCTR